MNATDIKQFIDRLLKQCIHHFNFDQTTKDIESQVMILQPGEVLTVVGPSRAGKSRATRQAFENTLGDLSGNDDQRPLIWIDNENSQASGEFSTKAFMLEACKAIDHPIYGRQHSMSSEGLARLQSHITRTPESVFRDAFESGLKELKTRYLVIDEAHHVIYARGGEKVAAKILDSWKCLAQKTGIVLVLVGSYALVSVMEHAPHLIGRQRRPLEFPRYRSSAQDDILAFDAVLAVYSKGLPFIDSKTSLRKWNRQLFEGSLGCVGHLSLWIRSALGWMLSHMESHFTWRALEATAFVSGQFDALLRETEEGEKKMASVVLTAGHEKTSVAAPNQRDDSDHQVSEPKKGKSGPRPFTKKTRRRARGERA